MNATSDINANSSFHSPLLPPSRSGSTSPLPHIRSIMMQDNSHFYPSYQIPQDYMLPSLPRTVLHSKAFSLPQATPLSSRSPSVASWCSFDSDYDDGLIIEEIDSDDENLDDSDVEVIEGEYEDPPSDDDEYWDRWRHRQQLNDTQEVIVNCFEDLSTSARAPEYAVVQTPRLYTPPVSPAPSTGFKRSFVNTDTDGDETDRDDSRSSTGRRTRRKMIPKSPAQTRPTQVTRGFNVLALRESEMQD